MGHPVACCAAIALQYQNQSEGPHFQFSGGPAVSPLTTSTFEACKKCQVKCKLMFLCQTNRVTQSLADFATKNVYFLVAKLSNCRRITVFLSISASVVCCQCRQIDGSSEPQHNKVTLGFIFISRNDKYFHFQNYKYFCTSNTLTFVSDTE